ncbi:MAG: potassium transporter Kup [Gemmatimonadota bacterium]|jgi:KUP system potassium uptake protein|nr:potassium transporter Kup [Gemmatimonadota bacterium]
MTARHDGETNPGPTHPPARGRGYLAALSLSALGVVFGDLGTSPLYSLREAFVESHGVALTTANILGVLSLVFWALVIVISIKYLVFILRADNRGEGGILALTSLLTPSRGDRLDGRWVLILLGLFGTALLYGDGMITPAITVLSAVEGLEIVTPFFDPYVIPITIAILIGIFSIQHRGTGSMGKIFGPILLVWFLTIAMLGVIWIVQAPEVLRAINPLHGARFLIANGFRSFLVLGSVVLVLTGGEALYADMGHFGRTPIRLAWFTLVLPSLLLNYFGQGALLILRPEAASNPFFYLAPTWGLVPLAIIATMAAIIASQALISGAFSLTRQAVQLGYLPRVAIEHTSVREIGQIYVPAVNWALMIACVALVLGFRTSSNLASAYGVAVVTTMTVTTILFAVIARERWKWSLPAVILVAGTFIVIDLAFWAGNLLKIPSGGWFPLVIGVVIFTCLTTWKKGRKILAQKLDARTLPRDLLLSEVALSSPIRVRGTAVFMSSSADGTPPALLHNLKHNQVLHEKVVLLSVITEEIPYVDRADHIEIRNLHEGIWHVVLHVGFMDSVDVPKSLMSIQQEGLDFRPMTTSYFLGRETLITTSRSPGMAIWREKLFELMTQNARPASRFFRLPPNRVVEMGTQIEL